MQQYSVCNSAPPNAYFNPLSPVIISTPLLPPTVNVSHGVPTRVNQRILPPVIKSTNPVKYHYAQPGVYLSPAIPANQKVDLSTISSPNRTQTIANNQINNNNNNHRTQASTSPQTLFNQNNIAPASRVSTTNNHKLMVNQQKQQLTTRNKNLTIQSMNNMSKLTKNVPKLPLCYHPAQPLLNNVHSPNHQYPSNSNLIGRNTPHRPNGGTRHSEIRSPLLQHDLPATTATATHLTPNSHSETPTPINIVHRTTTPTRLVRMQPPSTRQQIHHQQQQFQRHFSHSPPHHNPQRNSSRSLSSDASYCNRIPSPSRNRITSIPATPGTPATAMIAAPTTPSQHIAFIPANLLPSFQQGDRTLLKTSAPNRNPFTKPNVSNMPSFHHPRTLHPRPTILSTPIIHSPTPSPPHNARLMQPQPLPPQPDLTPVPTFTLSLDEIVAEAEKKKGKIRGGTVFYGKKRLEETKYDQTDESNESVGLGDNIFLDSETEEKRLKKEKKMKKKRRKKLKEEFDLNSDKIEKSRKKKKKKKHRNKDIETDDFSDSGTILTEEFLKTLIKRELEEQMKSTTTSSTTSFFQNSTTTTTTMHDETTNFDEGIMISQAFNDLQPANPQTQNTSSPVETTNQNFVPNSEGENQVEKEKEKNFHRLHEMIDFESFLKLCTTTTTIPRNEGEEVKTCIINEKEVEKKVVQKNLNDDYHDKKFLDVKKKINKQSDNFDVEEKQQLSTTPICTTTLNELEKQHIENEEMKGEKNLRDALDIEFSIGGKRKNILEGGSHSRTTSRDDLRTTTTTTSTSNTNTNTTTTINTAAGAAAITTENVYPTMSHTNLSLISSTLNRDMVSRTPPSKYNHNHIHIDEIRVENLRDRSRDPTRTFSEENDSLATTDEMACSVLRSNSLCSNSTATTNSYQRRELSLPPRSPSTITSSPNSSDLHSPTTPHLHDLNKLIEATNAAAKTTLTANMDLSQLFLNIPNDEANEAKLRASFLKKPCLNGNLRHLRKRYPHFTDTELLDVIACFFDK